MIQLHDRNRVHIIRLVKISSAVIRGESAEPGKREPPAAASFYFLFIFFFVGRRRRLTHPNQTI